jgi:ribose transport system substrate-binding protein
MASRTSGRTTWHLGLALVGALTVSLLAGCSLQREPAAPTAAPAAASAPTAAPAAPAAAKPTAAPAAASADIQNVPRLDGKKIGISIIGTDHHWDRNAFEGATNMVTQLGGTPIAVQAERNSQKHIADLENLIQQKPDAIISILGDAKALDPVFKKVHDAEIPLFTVDQPSPYSMNNVTSDNYYIGEALGRTIAEDMHGKGNLLVFNGFTSVRVCQIRYNELREVLKDYPGIQIIQPELQDIAPGTVEDARRKITDTLNRLPAGQIDAVWACWDIPEIGAAQAIDEAGRKEIKVYGIDGDPNAVDMVAAPNSSYTATMAQLPLQIGQASAANVARYLAGQKAAVPGTTYFQPFLVTKANANEAKTKLFGPAQ